MLMNNVGIIDRFLDVFTRYIDSGFGLVGGDIAFLTSTLIVIDITLAGLFWAWGADEDVMQRLIKKTLYIGFFAFIIGNFNTLVRIVFESFSGLGLKAGGSTITTAEFLRPGRLAQVGLDAGQPLLDAAGKLMGYISFFEHFVQIAVLMVSWLLVVAAFFILAIQLFVALIEFKLTTLAGFVLIPFALFNKTAFLAEKVLGNVVASGVKVLVLAIIVGIGTTLFGEFTTGFGNRIPTIEECASVVLAALSLFGLGIFGPGIAGGLLSGAPQLGAGAAAGTGLAAAGLGMAGVMGARAAIGGAASAISGAGQMTAAAAKGGAFVAGAASTAYGMGSAGQTGAAGVAAGMSGVGKAAAGAAISPLKNAVAKAGTSLKQSYQSGGRAAVSATGGTTTGARATPGAAASPPAWAQAMKRNQHMAHGVSTAAHAVRAGDHGGGGASVDLSERSG
jgi:type IV secretion system protein TrbL